MAAHRIRIAHSLKTLGSVLIVLALSASGAEAIEIPVEVGTPGEPAFDLSFFMPPGDNDLVFFDNEALRVSGNPTVMSFILSLGFPVQYNGFLLDQLGEKIDGTEYMSVVSGDAVAVPLAPGTVWYGMRLSGAFDPGNYLLAWIPENPTVVPEPGTALLMGLGLAGLGIAGRPRRTLH